MKFHFDLHSAKWLQCCWQLATRGNLIKHELLLSLTNENHTTQSQTLDSNWTCQIWLPIVQSNMYVGYEAQISHRSHKEQKFLTSRQIHPVYSVWADSHIHDPQVQIHQMVAKACFVIVFHSPYEYFLLQ